MAGRRGKIDATLERQAADLDSLEDRHLRNILRALDDSRRELREQLERTSSPSRGHQLRLQLAQAEAGVAHIRARMGAALADAEYGQQDAAREHLLETVRKAEPKFRDPGPEWEAATLRRLTDERGLALHRYSIDRYGAQLLDAIQRELAVGYSQGLTAAELADRVAGTDGVIARHHGRAALIVRMELSRVYDAAHQASLEELAALDSPDTADPLLKRADETRDHRNHPFSRLLDNAVALPRQEWEIEVTRPEARRGLVWRVTGNVAHGFGFPAHYNDRGRQVPWRMSWEGKAYQPKRSIHQADITDRDVRGLRKIDKGRPATDLTGAGRRTAELAGWLDGQGRLTPQGKRELFPDRLMPTGGLNEPAIGTQDLANRKRNELSVLDEQAGQRALAREGYRTEWVPRGETKTPDLLVEGRRLDVTRGANPVTIRSRLRKKVEDEQADYFVVPCERANFDRISRYLAVHPPPGAKVVWMLVDDELIRVIG